MCTRYISPDAAAIDRHWGVGRNKAWGGGELQPRSHGAFIRARRASHGVAARELAVGQWGLIPWFARGTRLDYSAATARFEDITVKAAFREPWRYGKRCVIPAQSFDAQSWESGRTVWWRLRRSDGAPWGIAGVWSNWTDRSNGEQIASFTMLTVNADDHPLLRRMHRPDPRLPADRQDTRCLVSIEAADVDRWLCAPIDEAVKLVRLTPVSLMLAAPAAPIATSTI